MVEMERAHFGIRLANVANNLHRNQYTLTPYSPTLTTVLRLHLLLLNIGASHRSARRTTQIILVPVVLL